MPKPWLNILEQALLVLLCAFLILPNAISSIALVALVGIGVFKHRWSFLPARSDWWLALPVIALLIAWIRGGFATGGWPELQLWATWIAASLYFRSSSYQHWFLTSFVWVNSALALAFLGWIYWLELPAENYAQILRDTIGSELSTHPTYLSAIWFWTAVIAYSFFYQSSVLRTLLPLLLIVAALFAGGKMPLLGFAVAVGFIVVKSIKKPLLRWITLGSFAIGFLLAISFHPVMQTRIAELQSLDTEYDEGQWLSSTELRLGVWKCSWDAALNHWMIGTGLGNTRKTLEACYRTFEKDQFFTTEFNTHNQFLHFLLAGGIPALLLWLYFWFRIVDQARRKEGFILSVFLLYSLLIFQTENYLSRQDGMMFWSFMCSCLLFLSSARPTSDPGSLAR